MRTLLNRVDFVYMYFRSLKLETTFSHTTCCIVLKLETTSSSYYRYIGTTFSLRWQKLKITFSDTWYWYTNRARKKQDVET